MFGRGTRAPWRLEPIARRQAGGLYPALALCIAALALLAAACGGGNNNGAATKTASATVRSATAAIRPSAAVGTPVSTTGAVASPPASGSPQPGAPGTPPAGASATANPAACSNATAAPTPGGSPTATPTPDPQTLAVAQKLAPALIQLAELPPGERDFQPTGVFPVTNRDSVPPTATGVDCLRQQVELTGRIGGVISAFGKAGQYVAGQHTPISLSDNCSAYQTADGAKQGLALVFSQVNQPQKSSAGDQVSTSPLTPDPIGDETRAVRVDTNLTVAAGSGNATPTFVRIRQTFFNLSWRQGTAVCTLQLGAIDEDPSLGDMQALAKIQNDRLKAAGY